MTYQMAFPKSYAALDEMMDLELKRRARAWDIARKAGIQQGTILAQTKDVQGTFSATNDPAGYVLSAGAFPDASSMDRLADLTGVDEARLVVNVSVAGSSGTTLSVSGAVSASVPLDVVGVSVSEWSAVSSGLIEYSASGVATVGLIQLQTR